MLAPARGRTKTGRIWTYVVDERPWTGGRPPAALYRYSPDRKGERPAGHLTGYRGVIHADAYSGYEALTRSTAPPGIVHAACWAHARRKLYDVHEATASPIAAEGLRRIGELYDVERGITGQSAERRLAQSAASAACRCSPSCAFGWRPSAAAYRARPRSPRRRSRSRCSSTTRKTYTGTR